MFLRDPSGRRLFPLTPIPGAASPAQGSPPLRHFALSPGRRSPPPGGSAPDRRVSSPSPLPPGRPARQSRSPPPSSPQAGPRLAPSSSVFFSAGSPLPSLRPQPIPRPAPRARRSPADSPVLIQSGLAMLAMAKISAARKRHPEMMVSLSISPPRSPHPPSPGQAAASRLPPHGPPPGPGDPAPPPRAPSAPVRCSRPPRARDQQPRRGPHSRNRRPPRNCSARPPLTRKRSRGAGETGSGSRPVATPLCPLCPLCLAAPVRSPDPPACPGPCAVGLCSAARLAALDAAPTQAPAPLPPFPSVHALASDSNIVVVDNGCVVTKRLLSHSFLKGRQEWGSGGAAGLNSRRRP